VPAHLRAGAGPLLLEPKVQGLSAEWHNKNNGFKGQAQTVGPPTFSWVLEDPRHYPSYLRL